MPHHGVRFVGRRIRNREPVATGCRSKSRAFWVDEYVTRSDSDCVETRFAAVPPDVRKGCALPARVDGIRGYAPTQGRSPGMIRVLPPVGRSRHRTSGGTAANRSFIRVSVATGCNLRYTNRSMRGSQLSQRFALIIFNVYNGINHVTLSP